LAEGEEAQCGLALTPTGGHPPTTDPAMTRRANFLMARRREAECINSGQGS